MTTIKLPNISASRFCDTSKNGKADWPSPPMRREVLVALERKKITCDTGQNRKRDCASRTVARKDARRLSAREGNFYGD